MIIPLCPTAAPIIPLCTTIDAIRAGMSATRTTASPGNYAPPYASQASACSYSSSSPSPSITPSDLLSFLSCWSRSPCYPEQSTKTLLSPPPPSAFSPTLSVGLLARALLAQSVVALPWKPFYPFSTRPIPAPLPPEAESCARATLTIPCSHGTTWTGLV